MILAVKRRISMLLYVRVSSNPDLRRSRYLTYMMDRSSTRSASTSRLIPLLVRSPHVAFCCGERASPEAWLEPMLVGLVGFAQKKRMMLIGGLSRAKMNKTKKKTRQSLHGSVYSYLRSIPRH